MPMSRMLAISITVVSLFVFNLGCGDIEVPEPVKNAAICTPKCATTQVCHEKLCCTPNCENSDGSPKECGHDGCGGTCGTCAPNQTCAPDRICRPKQ